MISRYQCGEWLNKAIGKNQSSYIPADCKKLIFDAKILDDVVDSTSTETKYFDYSFVVAPVYKATEGILWKIATDLNLIQKDGNIGSFFDESNVDANIDQIATNIVDRKKKEEIRQQLSEIKTFLKRYRHIPAHYGSRFETLEEARLASSSSLHNLSCLIKDLLQLKLVKIEESSAGNVFTDEEEINPEDIPF